MQISTVGMNLIKSFEGCRLTSYQDIGGVWTIGYGHTNGVTSGQTITQQQADSLLMQDLQKFSDAVSANVHVNLNQYQFDSLVSFCYNVGVGAFKTSTLLEMLNQGDYAGASNQFLLWTHVGQKVIQGLVTRRNAEKALFDRMVESGQPSQTGTVYVVATKLNLRKAPNNDGEIIRELNKGESYTYYQVVNGWYDLGMGQWANGGNGQYLSLNPPATVQDYTIRTGENLTIIAKRMNTSVKDLMNLNPSIKNANLVYAGQKIKVPSK
jgi:lysozyme